MTKKEGFGTVFVVFSGSHDDYGPEAMFTKRKNAERFRKFHAKNDRYKHGHTNIERWNVDLPKWLWVKWIIRFKDDKSVASAEKYVDAGRGDRAGGFEKPFRDSSQYLCMCVKARSRKDAIKEARVMCFGGVPA